MNPRETIAPRIATFADPEVLRVARALNRVMLSFDDAGISGGAALLGLALTMASGILAWAEVGRTVGGEHMPDARALRIWTARIADAMDYLSTRGVVQ